MSPFRPCGPPKKVPEILSSESLLKKNILPIPLSSSRWSLNSQHPLHLRVGSGESDGKVQGQLDLSVMHISITPSRPAHGNEAQGTRSQGSHSCACTILTPVFLSPLEMPYLFVLGNHKAHFKAHLFQEVCPNPQSTVSSHLRTPRVFVIQSSGGFQRSCFVWYCFAFAGLICEWLELRVSACFVFSHDS